MDVQLDDLQCGMCLKMFKSTGGLGRHRESCKSKKHKSSRQSIRADDFDDQEYMTVSTQPQTDEKSFYEESDTDDDESDGESTFNSADVLQYSIFFINSFF